MPDLRANVIHVQDGWSFGAVEQNGDAGGTGGYVDDDANLASQFWATNCSELGELETIPTAILSVFKSMVCLAKENPDRLGKAQRVAIFFR